MEQFENLASDSQWNGIMGPWKRPCKLKLCKGLFVINGKINGSANFKNCGPNIDNLSYYNHKYIGK